jgi:hypothetical protein
MRCATSAPCSDADSRGVLATWAYPWDLLDRGVDGVLGAVRDAGFDTVSLATVYHGVQSLQPRGHRFWFSAGDSACYFPADVASYGPVRPRTFERDVVTPVVEGIRRAGLRLTSWVVFLHSTLARDHPEAAMRTIDGDIHAEGLCPANPLTVDYVLPLAEEIDQRYAPDVIDVEAIGWTALPHHAHAKTGIRISPLLAYLLAICWCEACAALAPFGLLPALRRLARAEREGASRHASLAEALASDPDLAAFQERRERAVTDLTRALRSRMRARIHLIHSGETRAQGLSLRDLATIADRMTPVTSTGDPDACAGALRAATDEAGIAADRLVAGVSLLDPPIPSPEAFGAVLDAIAGAGVRDLSVYNASLVDPERLDWCRGWEERWPN